MIAFLKVGGLSRRKPLTADRLRALEEAERAKDHLRGLKAASRSVAPLADQLIDASRRTARN